MPRFVLCLVASAAMSFLGFSRLQAGILFDNGLPVTDNVGLLNDQGYTVYDSFTLSTASIIDGVTWKEHDSTNSFRNLIFYNSTDITIFNAVPSINSEIFSKNFVADSRTANGSPPVFDNTFGFDCSITTGLSLNLSAGTYYIGIYNIFDGGEYSSWDLAATNNSSPGRYQTNSPPAAGTFRPNEDSVFQILGTSISDPAADPAPQPAPEPAAYITASVLLGLFGIRRAARRLGPMQST